MLPLALTLLVAGTLVAGTGCVRGNPRLTEVKKVRGTEDTPGGVVELSTLTLSYDDAFHPETVVSVEQTDQGELVETFELTWVGKKLTAHSRSRTLEGDPIGLESTTWTYAGSHVDSVDTDLGDRQTRGTRFSYANGKIEKIVTTNTFPGGRNGARQRFRYSDDDELGSLTTELFNINVDENGDDVEEPTGESKTAITLQKGKPSRLTLTNDGSEDETEVVVAYKEGRLKSFDRIFTPADPAAEPQSQETRLSYDDEDRIAIAVQPGEDAEDAAPETLEDNDIFFTLTYDDEGDAEDLDVTPYRLLNFPLWDLRGAAFTNIQENEQAPRLVDLFW